MTGTRGVSYVYNTDGFLESITDAENHTTTYTYNDVGRVTRVDRPDASTVQFTYDNNGNMTVLTTPSVIDHGFGFNKVNLNISYDAPLSGRYSYVHDKDRRLIQTNFPSGKQILNIFDKSRLKQSQTPEGNIDFAYGCGSRVESITKGLESITYGYDGDLLTSETLTGALNQTLSYTYNNDFSPTSLTYAGFYESFVYDNDGLLTGAGAFTIFRNAQNGLPESVGDGVFNLNRTFNGYGEISDQAFAVNSQNIASWSLTRDNAGRITNKTETIDGSTSNYVYTYDEMGRLLTVTKDDVLVEEYQYGLNGARTYEMNVHRGIVGKNYTYSDEDHLLTAGSVTYLYDYDGFLASKTDGSDVTLYNYSSRGELLSVTLPNNTVIEYVHDPLGRRVAKKIDGVVTEKYLWEGLTRLLAVYDGSDNLIMRFEYADGRMPFALTSDGVRYYLTYDQVGSLKIVSDAAGNIVKRVDCDSFGNIINDSNPDFQNPFGFAGGLHDRDTGFVRFSFRDYDPYIGRWTAKDPILFTGGDTDLYGYVLNNPIDLIDPLGLVGSHNSATEHIQSLILTGRIGRAIEYAKIMGGPAALKLLRQAQNLQRTLNNLVAKYPLTSNKCAELAKGIHKAFKNVGADPIYYHLDKLKANFVGVGKNYVIPQHVVVRVGNKIYDAYTGAQGMTYSAYVNMLDRVNGVNQYSFSKVDKIPF